MSTKLDFICEYKRELLARYDWAQDEARLAKFMLSLHKTPHGTKTCGTMTARQLLPRGVRLVGQR